MQASLVAVSHSPAHASLMVDTIAVPNPGNTSLHYWNTPAKPIMSIPTVIYANPILRSVSAFFSVLGITALGQNHQTLRI